MATNLGSKASRTVRRAYEAYRVPRVTRDSGKDASTRAGSAAACDSVTNFRFASCPQPALERKSAFELLSPLALLSVTLPSTHILSLVLLRPPRPSRRRPQHEKPKMPIMPATLFARFFHGVLPAKTASDLADTLDPSSVSLLSSQSRSRGPF